MDEHYDYLAYFAVAVSFLFSLTGCTDSAGTVQHPSSPNIRESRYTQKTNANAVVAFQHQQYDTAIQLFKEQLKSGVKDEHKLWFNIGASYWNLRQKDDALEAYEQAAAVNPLYLKAHNRLGGHYFLLERKDKAASHAKVAAAIRSVDRDFAPFWDKANDMRAKGAVYYKAVATLHETAAGRYEKLGLSAQAEAERKLAEQSRAEEARERQRPIQEAQRAETEAEERVFNAELLGTVKDLSATIMKVNPDAPFAGSNMYAMGGSAFMNAPTKPLGGNSGQTAMAGLGVAEQAFGTYADILNAYGSQLQAQREAVYQQGQKAQDALADPTQAKIQQDARKRTESLMKQLEEAERLANEYLAEQGELADIEEKSERDTLDL
jgi:tetratricopeptide (TPR) repeat protein